jgi:acyl-CoA synthetase (AMP-forming)/AMP-acid ligase II
VVVLRPGAAAMEAEFRAHCLGRLSRFEVPRAVNLVPSLPKGGTGKIPKREVRERYWVGHAKRVH